MNSLSGIFRFFNSSLKSFLSISARSWYDNDSRQSMSETLLSFSLKSSNKDKYAAFFYLNFYFYWFHKNNYYLVFGFYLNHEATTITVFLYYFADSIVENSSVH